MGRRSQHTPEELRELILVATRRVVEEEGISQPSAREIARAIGYAPGTLYNMYSNLGDILLHVEARIFHELTAKIVAATRNAKGRDAVRAYLDAYVGYACDNPKLWALINHHQPEPSTIIHGWYREAVHAPQAQLEILLDKTHPDLDQEAIKDLSRLIWTSLQGLIQASTTSKFGEISRATMTRMAQQMVEAIVSAKVGQPNIVTPSRRTASQGRSASAAE